MLFVTIIPNMIETDKHTHQIETHRDQELSPREHLTQLINDVRSIHHLDESDIERREALIKAAGSHALAIVHAGRFKQIVVKSYLDAETKGNPNTRKDVLRLLTVANDTAKSVAMENQNPPSQIRAIKRHAGVKRRLGL